MYEKFGCKRITKLWITNQKQVKGKLSNYKSKTKKRGLWLSNFTILPYYTIFIKHSTLINTIQTHSSISYKNFHSKCIVV